LLYETDPKYRELWGGGGVAAGADVLAHAERVRPKQGVIITIRHTALDGTVTETRTAGGRADLTTPTPETGPGTELKKLLAGFGIEPKKTCDCNSRMSQMNRWGVAGCREHRAEIVGWMREEFAQLGWVERIRVGLAAAGSGQFGPVAAFDPVGAVVDRAIQSAE
jgi:hypothetical protein